MDFLKVFMAFPEALQETKKPIHKSFNIIIPGTPQKHPKSMER